MSGTVLVVEDDAVQARSIATYLVRQGWEVESCATAEEEVSVLLAVLALRLVWTASEVVMIALVWRMPGPPVLLREAPP